MPKGELTSIVPDPEAPDDPADISRSEAFGSSSGEEEEAEEAEEAEAAEQGTAKSMRSEKSGPGFA